ncbi:MAG: hypothetical protein ACJ8C4_02960 [Gemmataceae bacterium]
MLEVVFHVVAVVIVFRPMARLQWQHLLPHIRAAVAERLTNWWSERYPELHDSQQTPPPVAANY